MYAASFTWFGGKIPHSLSLTIYYIPRVIIFTITQQICCLLAFLLQTCIQACIYCIFIRHAQVYMTSQSRVCTFTHSDWRHWRCDCRQKMNYRWAKSHRNAGFKEHNCTVSQNIRLIQQLPSCIVYIKLLHWWHSVTWCAALEVTQVHMLAVFVL